MNWKRFLIGITATVGLFVLGVVLFNSVLMPMLVHQRGAVIVPALQNTSESQAQHALTRLGLNMRVDREEHHPEVPAGFVISQTPRPNDTIKEGRTVEVVVSLGARTVVVPELRGMSIRQTRGVLDRQNLRIGRVSRVMAKGSSREEVLAQTPAPGEEMVEGAEVNIVIAVGGQKQEFAMPDLEGQDLLFIREKLRDLGFRISGVRYEKRDGVFPNTIVGQSPAAGALIREGDSIELVAASSD